MTSGNGPSAQNRTHNLLLGLILAIAAFVQFTVVSRSEVNVPLRADAAHYYSYAYNLKTFGVFSGEPTWTKPGPATAPAPDSITTPGYPIFLLAIPGLAPNDAYLLRVTFAQAAMGVLSVWLVCLIAGRFLPSPATLVVGLLTAISPHLATISTYVLTESLFLFLMLCSLYLSIRGVQSKDTRLFILAGISWGLCSLVRSTVQFIPPLVIVAVMMVPAFRAYRRGALLLLVAFLAVQAPWQIRNRVSPISDAQPNLIVNFLHHGSYPGFMYEDQKESFGFPYRFDPDNAKNSADIPAVLKNIAGHFVDEPGKYATWYLIGKPITLFSWGIINGFGDIYTYPPNRSPYLEDALFIQMRSVMLWLHWPIMTLAFGGLLAVWACPRQLRLTDEQTSTARIVSALLVYVIAFHVIGAPFPRYGIPFRPLMYMMALLLISAPMRKTQLTQVDA